MDYTAVKSSSIHEVGYDSETKTLGITFKNGRTYEYDDVHPVHYDELLKAESAGKYFHSNVRNVFQTRPVEREQVQEK